MTRHARAERLALADLMAVVGPDARTLCGDWTVRDLAAHLVLRERRLDAAPGILLKRFSGQTEKVQRRLAARDFGSLLRDLRHPPLWSPVSNPVLDEALNFTEMFVHHEDVRRARPGWSPRHLDPGFEKELWTAVRRRTPLVLRRFRAIVHVESPGFGAARGGPKAAAETVRVTGRPGELLLFLFGRQAHSEVTVDGPSEPAQRLQRARLGI